MNTSDERNSTLSLTAMAHRHLLWRQSVPTDGAVYDPELAHCCSCEPAREAAITLRLEKDKAEALKACLQAQLLDLKLQRHRMLLQRGNLAPFEPLATPFTVSVDSDLEQERGT